MMPLTATTPIYETLKIADGSSSHASSMGEKNHPHPRNTSRKSGTRLSWPNAGDRRRAVVGKSPSHKKGDTDPHVSDTRIVHVSHRDIEMHYHFTSSSRDEFARPVMEIPLVWNSMRLEKVENQHLFQYFQHTASKSLATFGYDPTRLGNVLMRIAVTGTTASATAVLHSLLALSALQGQDGCAYAVELKISALKALAATSGSGLGTMEAIQHVAAGMLLCSFEIHQASCTSDSWMCYLTGVKNIIEAAGLDRLHQDSDLAMLLDWVYYHDVVSRFSQRHWHGESTESSPTASSAGSTPTSPSMTSCNIRAQMSHGAPPALTAIELLSDVCDAVSDSHPSLASAEREHDHKSFLKILDWKIRSMKTLDMAQSNTVDQLLIMELYQLAMLVYLNQASENLLNQAASTQKQIDRAFVILAQLASCERQFPIFVFGCVARSDHYRAVLLDLISRTENTESSRSFNHVRLLLQAIWAQDDLAGEDANFCDKLTYFISCCKVMPCFV